jgi:antitoxin MazE
MKAVVRKMGNSSGVIIPKPILAQIGIQTGDDLDLSLDDDRIVLAPARRHPCTGWADAAKRIADAADDALAWPEFGNAGDADLEWYGLQGAAL